MMKIAIIGSGISGLGAAWLLQRQGHEITVYEKNPQPGGHSRTLQVETANGQVAVDTGFIVYNDRTYPNLNGLFQELGVNRIQSRMSFGASIDDGWFEYSSNGLFAQRRNLIRPSHWRMIADILKFNRLAPRYLEISTEVTLSEFLQQLGLGDWFRRYYLLAMGAAIWSCPVNTMLSFPARTFLRFFHNHGLLSVNDHPQWYTVAGGSREYVSLIANSLNHRIRSHCGVTAIVSHARDRHTVIDDCGEQIDYDTVILACHADQALSMLEQPEELEQKILGAFNYQENRVVLHGDTSFMPRRRRCWASWIYLNEGRTDERAGVSLSYWMNNLQDLDPRHPLLVTLNPARMPRADLTYDEHIFRHPIFDQAAIRAQSRLKQIQGRRGLWFCGAWQRYGFHEDGLLSAVQVASRLGANIPWQ